MSPVSILAPPRVSGRRPARVLAAAALLALLTRALTADAITASPTPAAAPAPAGAIVAPPIAAPAYLLTDVTSGQVIVAENADERRDPASLTKLMTAYLVFAALRDGKLTLTQEINVSAAAWHVEGSRMFIEPKRPVSIDMLLHGLIVQSGNDSAVALAEAVAGGEAAFAERMNVEAKRMGLAGTHFVNATGLADPQHYSTASDIATLAMAVIRDFPEFYPLYALKEYRYNNITQPNRNRLLWVDPYADGMKTGHTETAGWCLVGSAKRGARRVLSVVLGAASDAARTNESQKLLNFGFQSFDTIELYAPDKPVSTLKVWKGAVNDVAAGFTASRYLTLPKGAADRLKLTLVADEPLIAPVAKGQRIGTVKVGLDGRALAEFPLFALSEAPAANIFGRAYDSVRLWWARR
jgi:serine-type D-Ala-D-Ala carboxypeptidase (penicillin-binding protein 5/6)